MASWIGRKWYPLNAFSGWCSWFANTYLPLLRQSIIEENAFFSKPRTKHRLSFLLLTAEHFWSVLRMWQNTKSVFLQLMIFYIPITCLHENALLSNEKIHVDHSKKLWRVLSRCEEKQIIILKPHSTIAKILIFFYASSFWFNFPLLTSIFPFGFFKIITKFELCYTLTTTKA